MTFISLDAGLNDTGRNPAQGSFQDPFGRKVLTPSSLSARIQENFTDFGAVWLLAEISDFRSSSAGHWYFSLKDQQAVVKAVVWKKRQAYLPIRPQDGRLVMVRGRLDIYAPRGDYHLTVDYLELQGEGALRLAFEKLKAQLEAEGLFRPERKKKLPFWPGRVALITSPSGAVVMDFVSVAEKRRPNLQLSVYPVKVQGPEAAEEMIKALGDLNRWDGFDLIVLARGGGSLEDLWAFNHEGLARAISASRIPVVSAVGHETDFTIADHVADLRAPTPSAAAEIIYRSRSDLEAHLKASGAGMRRLLDRKISRIALELGHVRARLDVLPRRLNNQLQMSAFQKKALSGAFKNLILARANRLERLSSRLFLNSPQARWSRQEGRADQLKIRLVAAVRERLNQRDLKMRALSDRLRLLSPLNVLNRGYALVFREPDSASIASGQGPFMVRSAAELRDGDCLTLRLADGTRQVKVLEDINHDD